MPPWPTLRPPLLVPGILASSRRWPAHCPPARPPRCAAYRQCSWRGPHRSGREWRPWRPARRCVPPGWQCRWRHWRLLPHP
uniref:Putative secreted protein n=1 Tax=Ixodes ricinus TaxID=34613 RepID=A0A6B0U574_IXORI